MAGAAIGAVLGVLAAVMAIIVVLVVAFLLWRKNQKYSFKNNDRAVTNPTYSCEGDAYACYVKDLRMPHEFEILILHR